MIFIRKALFAACVSLACSGFSLEHKIDEAHPLQVSFSLTCHNRVAVSSGSVEKVIADPSLFSITLDQTTGQAFINVLQEINDAKALLTIISGSGFVQDIEVRSHEGAPAFVLLKEPDDSLFIAQATLSIGPSVDVLNKILEQNIPFGYGEKVLDEEDAFSLPPPLTVHPLKAFAGPFETIVLYEVSNEGDVPIILSTEAARKKNGWVFFNIRELHSQQHALCLVGRSNGIES